MSIISRYEEDRSEYMYKHFAEQAFSYLDNPEKSSLKVTQIPLENLFRLLEMYRYDSFSDESRVGILAIGDHKAGNFGELMEATWHENIERALDDAFDISEVETKDQAVEDLEETLRALSSSSNIEGASLKRAKDFFTAFIDGL